MSLNDAREELRWNVVMETLREAETDPATIERAVRAQKARS